MIRFVGAIFLVAGCSGFGYSLARANRTEIKMLHNLLHAVQEMEWELKYRMTELPALLRISADAAGGNLKSVFDELAQRLENNDVEDISGSLNGIVSRNDLPRRVGKNLKQLGRSLGKFDLEGQLQGLQTVRAQCRKDLNMLEKNGPQRRRNYQTLALCAGLALAILLV